MAAVSNRNMQPADWILCGPSRTLICDYRGTDHDFIRPCQGTGVWPCVVAWRCVVIERRQSRFPDGLGGFLLYERAKCQGMGPDGGQPGCVRDECCGQSRFQDAL